MSAAQLLIRGGLVADPASAIVEPRDILIEGTRIVALGAPGSIAEPRARIHGASNRLILPAFVNAHTHGHSNLVKGIADRWTLEASLTNGPWLAGARDTETIYLSALLGALDMLSKGCVSCFDLVYEFPLPTKAGFAAVARAYADAGMKAVLAPMVADKTLFTAIPGLLDSLPEDLRKTVSQFDLGSADATIAAIEEIAAARDDLPDGIDLAIAPTIPHHCSEDFLARCIDLAERYDLPIHMHIAESRLQATTARKLWGVSPVRYLADRGVLRPGFVAAHGVWLKHDDLDILAEHQCSVAHIPASNFRLGSGMAYVRAMLDRGINVGLATDGANSSDAMSMLQAMRLASYASRGFSGPRDKWLGAAETLRLATRGGADLAGFKHAGRMEAGADADLVFFDLDHLDFVPLTDPINQIVTAADSASVREVMANGRMVLSNGRFTAIDTSGLRERVRDTVLRLSAKLADARPLAARLEPHVVAFVDKASEEPLDIERFVNPREKIT
ncbi:amidohydrolase family protein [Parvibaculum sp.]|uniref:amidohydrolase family protein n=1 Tax=Parvibaculum sp. TaxID=2024848 RepID=UPI00320C4FAD